jgi:thiol:disulfide interchange protein DsbC
MTWNDKRRSSWRRVGALAMLAALALTDAVSAAVDEEVPPLVRALWPDLKAGAVQSAPIGAGWREIVTPEGQVVYLDPSQRYAVVGQAMDLWTRRNLSMERLERERVVEVRTIPEEDVLWIKPEGPATGRIYVFDDPDCPYCREAHPRLAELAARGVEVGVLLYPVPRLHPAAYGKSVGIWCAADRRAALDRAMRGDPIDPPATACDHPVDRNLRLGRRMGVTGTPYWVAASGRALSGARPIEELLALSGGREDTGRPAQVTTDKKEVAR